MLPITDSLFTRIKQFPKFFLCQPRYNPFLSKITRKISSRDLYQFFTFTFSKISNFEKIFTLLSFFFLKYLEKSIRFPPKKVIKRLVLKTSLYYNDFKVKYFQLPCTSRTIPHVLRQYLKQPQFLQFGSMSSFQ